MILFKRRAQKKLLAKIHLAHQEAQSVARSGHNADQDFEFSRFEDVLAEGKRLLQKHRLVYVSEVVDVELIVGKKGVIAKTTIEYEVTDLDGGGSMLVTWVGTGHDSPGDKAVYKAETGTEKYFLARLLQIPWGDDPETHSGEPEITDDAAEETTWVLELGGVRDRLRKAEHPHDLGAIRLLLGACEVTSELPLSEGEVDGFELRLTEGERAALLAELARIEQDAIAIQADLEPVDG